MLVPLVVRGEIEGLVEVEQRVVVGLTPRRVGAQPVLEIEVAHQ
ncbi:MAG TPA: hypothetical protein VGN18_04795 [Jatrophihabitans sp.]|nr:hypothetical protein [Jatrophihabitans sp.]